MSDDNEGVKDKSQDAPPGEQAVEKEGAAAPIEPDWKDLLRLERERSEKAERDRDNYREGMLSYKGQLKARKAEDAPEAGDLDEKIAQGVAKAIEPVVSALQGNKIEQILASIVTDPAKREYVKSLYQSRIQRTGTSDEAIRQDLETALSLADASRFAKENEELKRMKDNRTYVPPNAGGGSSDGKGSAPKLYKWSPEQERSLEMRARANGISNVEKYKEMAWKAAQEGSAFDIKGKYL